MKRNAIIVLLYLTIMIASVPMAQAQIPQTLSYQGVLVNSAQEAVADGTYRLRFALYDREQGGAALWSEEQQVETRLGVFDAILGVQTPIVLPFTNAYWIGISMEGGSEMTPRIALVTVPYAMRAVYADTAKTLAPTAKDLVRSINGRDGHLFVKGEGNATVTFRGDTLIIRTTDISGGIQRIESKDSIISIQNPNGPISTLSIRNGSIGGDKLADSSITLNKLSWNIIPKSLPPNGPAGGDLAGSYPNPTLAQKGATSGQVLKWNGSAWLPSNDNGQSYTAGSGISIIGGVVANTGDTDPSNDITTSTNAGGDLTGMYPNPTLAQKGATSGQALVWNGTAWSPSSVTVTGSAGGDLSGSYPNPTIAPKGATSGQVLKWNGSAWLPSNDDNATYTAGSGISLTGGVVTNTGDTDPSNDITTSTSAGGDLTGVYPNPTLAQKGATSGQSLVWNGTAWSPSSVTATGAAGGDLSGTYPNPTIAPKGATSGQVLKWNGSAWLPSNDDNTNYTAGIGISLTGGVVSNTGDTDASNDITTSTSAGGDLTGIYPNPTLAQKGATSGQALVWNGTTWSPSSVTATGVAGGDLTGSYPNPTIAQKGATSGQVLKWSGSAWLPSNDDNATYTAGSGISLTGGVVTNTGDTDPSNDITTSTSAGGDLAGSYPNPTLAQKGATSGQSLVWNGTAWSPSSVTATGSAGGDLSGTYPNPTLAQKGATSGQVLKWNGSAWIPSSDDNTNYTAGSGISLTGGVVANTGDTDASNDITTSTNAGGDLTGVYPNPTLAQKGATSGQSLVWNGTAWSPSSVTATGSAGGDLSGTYPNPTLAQKGATSGQVLKWNGSAWIPSSDDNTNYTAGSGISLTGGVVANTGDTDASNDITTSTSAGGDLTGTYPNPTLAQKGATSGQVLKWNGSAWLPSNDDNTNYTAGSGISLTGGVVTNTGDTDPSNDITTSTSAGGDLTGTYPNPTLAQKGATSGQVLKWNGSAWMPANDDGQTYTAGSGISLSGGVVTNTGDTDPSNDITTSTSAGGDLTGMYPNPTLAQKGATTNQVLKWNGSAWMPANDDGQTYTAGSGINIVGGVVSNTGDTDPSNDITTSTSAGGDLTGVYPNPTLAQKGATSGQALVWNGTTWSPSSVTATGVAGGDLTGSYPNPTIAQKGATSGQSLVWNGTSWSPSSVTATGSAGGDLSGTYPNPTLAQKGATSGQVLKWNGSAWLPSNDDNTNYTAGSGISLTGGVVTNTGDTDPSNDITTSTSAGGDLTGTYPNPTLAQKGATSGQVLKWNGSAWMPANDDGQTYTAGSGISLSGGVVTNTGDTDPSNDITTSTSAGGDLTGTYPNPTLAQKGATSGQVLKWNGGAWLPSNDDNTTYTAGSGISLTGGVVTNTGDTDPSNDITTSTSAGGDLTGTYPNPTLAQKGATSGQVLKWNGSAWLPSNDNGDSYTAGGGISIVGGVVSNTGDTDASNDITTSTSAGGDLTGVYPNPTLAQKGATTNQVLKWNGSAWMPANDDGQTYTAGSGINIVGGVVSNTGDTDPSNDITTSTSAGGDLTGVYPNPTLAQKGATTNQVLKWNGSAWMPANDDGQTYTAGSGINIVGGVVSNTGDTDPSNDITTSTSAGGDLTGVYPNPTLAQKGATTNQVLKWNGSAWMPANDDGQTYTAGNGINIVGGVVSNTGDTDASNDITTSTSAGGDLTGVYPNPTLAQKGATTNQVLKWNGSAWMPANDDGQTYTAGSGINIVGGVVSNTGDTDASNDITTSTSAGGDLTGVYPNPTLAQKGATTNQVLKWNGSAWMPANDDGQTYTAGSGINIVGGVVSNTGDTDASNDITTSTSAGGDLTGVYPNPTLAQKGATTNQVLKWNGSAWMPANDDGQTYTAGSGINIVGGVVSNTGDTDASNDITTSTSAGGDLTGTYPNPTLAQKGATSGQVLKWNGSAWMPANDDGQTYTAGSGINIVGGVVSNTGDTDASNDITTSTSAGGDLTGVYPNPTLAQKGATTNQVLKWNGSAWMPANDDGQTYTAGSGISLTGGVVSNTGDTDASNDITTSTSAGGDLSGTYPNPIIAQKGATSGQSLVWNGAAWSPASVTATGTAGGDLSGTYPNPIIAQKGATSGQSLVWNGAAWSPASVTATGTAGGDLSGTYPNPTIAQKGATSGQSLVWNGTAWSPASVTATGTAGGDLSGTYPNPTIAQKGATSGQSLVWNGAAWSPASVTAIGTAGGDLSGTYPNPTIAQKGATSGQSLVWNGTAWSPASVTATGTAGGDLSGTYPNPTIAQKGATSGQSLVWNGTAWSPASVTATGTAGGDLSGTYPNPTIAQKGAINGQILKWNGSTWMPASDDNTTYTAGSGINIASGIITNTGDTDANNDITTSTSAGGDLSGTYPNPTVVRLQGRSVSSTAPTNGQALLWNAGSSTWVPQSISNITGTGNAAEVAFWNSTSSLSSSSNLYWNNTSTQLGIGTNSTITPLTFSAASGSKISFGGTAGAHYGLGVQSNLLQIYSNAPNSDIAFGTGSSGSFNELVRINTPSTPAYLDPRMQIVQDASAVSETAQATFNSHLELYSANTGDPQNEVRLRFQQATQYWGTIGYQSSTTLGRAKFTFRNLSGPGGGWYNDVSLHTTGGLILDTASSGAYLTPTLGKGMFYFDKASNKFKLSENGGAWRNLSGLEYFSEAYNTSGANATVPAASLTTTGAATNIDATLAAKGTGAITAHVADNAASGGNKRGNYAVDWQHFRSAATQVASGNYTTVSGGYNNEASGVGSVTAGGANNMSAHTYTVVSGGNNNAANGIYSIVGGGSTNTASGSYSTVGGGISNSATGTRSLIPGGSDLTIGGVGSFGFNGSNGAASYTTSVADSYTAYFGNVDLWLGNTRNQAGELRFYEAQNSSGAFPAVGTNYSSFKAGTQSADITYVLPTAQGAANTFLKNDGSGNLSWGTAGLQYFSEAYSTSAPNATVPISSLTATGSATDIDAAIVPKGSGALLARVADGTASGGGKRGTYSVDLQMLRTANTQIASGVNSVISGGSNNTASAIFTSVGGGYGNVSSNNNAVVSGGYSNTASGTSATVSGGTTNTASGALGTIAGGANNIASGSSSFIGGGNSNTASGYAATILGGESLTLSGVGSMGYNGSNGVPALAASISDSYTAYLGNVHLWLGNTRNQASELRFYEAQNAGGTFPGASTNYTAFKAGTQTTDISYTLPTSLPSANQVMGVTSVSGNNVTLDWRAASSLSYFTESIHSSLPNATVPVARLTPNHSATNVDASFAPKGSGAFLIDVPDNTTTGGNKRGNYTIDFQRSRTAATQVASGDNSIIFGGSNNTVAANTSTIISGTSNTIISTATYSSIVNGSNHYMAVSGYSFIGGGSYDTLSAFAGVIGGGMYNSIVADYANIGGGYQNRVVSSGLYGTVGGGRYNYVAGSYATVNGGYADTVTNIGATVSGGYTNVGAGDYSVVGGGWFNKAATTGATVGGGGGNFAGGSYSTVAGGTADTASATHATVGGGSQNSATFAAAVVAGGIWNKAAAIRASVLGGQSNVASGDYSTVGGGISDTASGNYTVVAGGNSNKASSSWAVISGGEYNTSSSTATVVAGGRYNTASGSYAIVGGGFTNRAGSSHAVVNGGEYNTASGAYSTVSGGQYDTASTIHATVGGGFYNKASGQYTVVAGGSQNIASGSGASIIGGDLNTASGTHSTVLGGAYSTANGDYNLVFGNDVDPTVTESNRVYFFDGTAPGRFALNRESASYPIHVGTSSSNGNGAYLTEGGVWTNGSSRTFKDRFQALDSVDVLNKVRSMDLRGWYYKGTEEYHIGPFAEDFRELFGTGVLNNPESAKYLAATDVAGVALYTSQQLLKQNEELRRENNEMKARLERLESIVTTSAAERNTSVPLTQQHSSETLRIISIAPDPAGEYAVLSFQLFHDGMAEVYILNAEGSRIKNVMNAVSMRAGRYEIEVQLRDVANGWYSAELRLDNNSAQRLFRVIK